MTFDTLYNIGDVILDNKGQEKEIMGVHVWLSDNKQTERYFFGNAQWRTIKRD